MPALSPTPAAARGRAPRLGVLLNHDQLHQVAHIVPIAVALRQIRPDVELVIAAGSDALATEAARLAARLGATLPIERLRPRRTATRLLVRALDAIAPAARLGVLRDNLAFFAGLDGLIVAEKTSLVLKDRFGLPHLPMIHSRHGAGDRAIGFDPASARFDHVLVAGAKIRDRLVADAGVQPARISVVGYPKFDLPPPTLALPFADPTRPLVLYNPHPAPHLSSWYRHGPAILRWFAASRRYNLLFAPHVMLFRRRVVATVQPFRLARVGGVPAEVRQADNILVDLGSVAATDMRYTDAADLYLGDVSSQVYEYLRRPRPCLFLNSHGVAYRDDPNYLAWAAGPVIAGPAELGEGVAGALASQPRFLAAQQRLLHQTFDLTDEPSGLRAARAVVRALGF